VLAVLAMAIKYWPLRRGKKRGQENPDFANMTPVYDFKNYGANLSTVKTCFTGHVKMLNLASAEATI